MKKFLLHAFLFALFLVLFFVASLFFIPNNRIKNNSLYSIIDKHQRLDSLDSPKIILVGGSNLAFGMDSKQLEDSLKMPVVNMGLHAGFGLKFMMNEIKHAIKKGDIIILSPEYYHFYVHNVFNGERVLVALLFDVYSPAIDYIDLSQFLHLMPLTIEYAASKLLKKQSGLWETNEDVGFEKVYNRDAFNLNGDVVAHWTYQGDENVYAMNPPGIKETVAPEVINHIVCFKKYIEDRGARLLLFPPVFQETSFVGFQTIINEISHSLSDNGIGFVESPYVYCYPDTLFFNTVYHLNYEGVQLRTNMVMEELKSLLSK